MNTTQITFVVKKDKFAKQIYLGTFSADQIPQTVKSFPICFIANSKPKQEAGEHWIAFFIDGTRRGFFFDSFGKPPQYYNENFKTFFVNNCTTYMCNTVQIQNHFSTVCGHYAIYFILMKCRNASFSEAISIFTLDYQKNDYLVKNVINYNFGLQTTMYDFV